MHPEPVIPFDNTEPRRTRTDKPRRSRNVSAEVRIVGSVDYVLLLITILLVLIGVVLVFSASYSIADIRFGNPFLFFRRNLAFAGAGFVIMLFLANFSYENIRPLSWLLYLVTVGLLVLVMLIGEEHGGAVRWIQVPVIGNFQPSEISRATIIFMLAYLIERNPKWPRTLIGLAILSGMVCIFVALIFLPGGFTVAIITSVVGFGLIGVASPHFWKFVVAGVIAAAGVGGWLWQSYISGADFRGGRFGVWLDPFSDPLDGGYQTIQSLYAIALGRWFGVGIDNSVQATFVPEPHNDIIFAIAIEVFGFFGAVVIILLFALFIWRGIITAMRAPDTFGALTALGIVFAIGFQAVINIAVVTNTIPNTGVNLPFISYGGTSLIVSMAMAGVLLNISRYSVQKGRRPKDRPLT